MIRNITTVVMAGVLGMLALAGCDTRQLPHSSTPTVSTTTVPTVTHGQARQTSVLQEGDAWFNCYTDGNKQCGPTVELIDCGDIPEHLQWSCATWDEDNLYHVYPIDVVPFTYTKDEVTMLPIASDGRQWYAVRTNSLAPEVFEGQPTAGCDDGQEACSAQYAAGR